MPSRKSRRSKRRGRRVEEPQGLAARELRARRRAVPNQPSDDLSLREAFISHLEQKKGEE